MSMKKDPMKFVQFLLTKEDYEKVEKVRGLVARSAFLRDCVKKALEMRGD
jgi:hypothetical protein